MQEELTLFPEEYPVSQQASQGSERAKQMTVGSGMRLYESLERLNLDTPFLKILLESSHWRMATHLKGYVLKWKVKATRSRRLLYQLAVSGRGIEEIGFGLFATPQAQPPKSYIPKEAEELGYVWKETSYYRKDGTKVQTDLGNQIMRMLPTPTTQEAESDCTLTQSNRRMTKDGKDSHSLNLARTVKMLPTPREVASRGNCQVDRGKGNLEDWVARMLPTPLSSDNRNRGNPEHPAIQRRKEKGKSIELSMTVSGNLNPDWVEWLMGYPQNWTGIGIENQTSKEQPK